MKKRTTTTLIALAFIMANFAGEAHAQLNNKPFSFSNSSRGIGMSVGAQQAIINSKINNIQPKNLVRGSSGELLDVQQGPGRTAIVTRQGTNEFIPQFRGSSFRGDNLNMSVGVFNAYFSPSSARTGMPIMAMVRSGATVSTWTGRVVSGGVPVSYTANNSIEDWTGQVMYTVH